MDDACERCRGELSALLDEELESSGKNAVQAHLNNCHDCLQALAEIKSLSVSLLSGMNDMTARVPVPDIWAKVQDNLPPLCEIVFEDLSAYIDDELPAAARDGVDRHLKGCEICTSVFKDLKETTKAISQGLKLSNRLKVDLWPAIKDRLDEDCALIQGELSSYADQEVATLRHRGITKHLFDCPICCEQFEKISRAGDLIRESYKPDFADDFDLWPQIKRQLQVVPFTARAVQAAQVEGKLKPQLRIANARLYMAASLAAGIAIFASLSFWLFGPRGHNIEPLSSEAYLIESAMSQPAEIAEAVVYDDQQ